MKFYFSVQSGDAWAVQDDYAAWVYNASKETKFILSCSFATPSPSLLCCPMAHQYPSQ